MVEREHNEDSPKDIDMLKNNVRVNTAILGTV